MALKLESQTTNGQLTGDRAEQARHINPKRLAQTSADGAPTVHPTPRFPAVQVSMGVSTTSPCALSGPLEPAYRVAPVSSDHPEQLLLQLLAQRSPETQPG